MKKIFELHEYTENMKAIIAIFSLKGKVDIWWKDVIRGILRSKMGLLRKL